jgi:hypothetical protein
MCTIAMKALEEGNKAVKADIQRLYGAYHEGELPETPAQLCKKVQTRNSCVSSTDAMPPHSQAIQFCTQHF